LEDLALEDVDVFCGHLVHFTVFCYIFWAFGIFCGNLVYFPPFWYFGPRKIWQPWPMGKDSCLGIFFQGSKVSS
jgi:hypothetical protein